MYTLIGVHTTLDYICALWRAYSSHKDGLTEKIIQENGIITAKNPVIKANKP